MPGRCPESISAFSTQLRRVSGFMPSRWPTRAIEPCALPDSARVAVQQASASYCWLRGRAPGCLPVRAGAPAGLLISVAGVARIGGVPQANLGANGELAVPGRLWWRGPCGRNWRGWVGGPSFLLLLLPCLVARPGTSAAVLGPGLRAVCPPRCCLPSLAGAGGHVGRVRLERGHSCAVHSMTKRRDWVFSVSPRRGICPKRCP